jgi:hypothetical protein
MLISFECCCHILDQDHNTLTFIICFKKLFICYYKIVVKNKIILIKFTCSICNQQLFFTFDIPISPYINNDTTIIVDLQLWKEFLNYQMESILKNIKIDSNLKTMIENTMVVNSIVMTICMSYISNHVLNFDSMLKFSTLKSIPLCKYCS